VAQAIIDAREGCLDFVASVVLVYERDKVDEEQFAFIHAIWKIYRVSDGKLLSSGKVRSADNLKVDAETTIKSCAYSISREVDTVLRKY
jgi:hypothetical protein